MNLAKKTAVSTAIFLNVFHISCSSSTTSRATLYKDVSLKGKTYPPGSSFCVKDDTIVFPNGEEDIKKLYHHLVIDTSKQGTPASSSGISLLNFIDANQSNCSIFYIHNGTLKKVNVSSTENSKEVEIISSNVIHAEKYGKTLVITKMWQKPENRWLKKLIVFNGKSKQTLCLFEKGKIDLLKLDVSRKGKVAILSKTQNGIFLNIYSPSSKWLYGKKLPSNTKSIFFLNENLFAVEGRKIYLIRFEGEEFIAEVQSNPTIYSPSKGDDFALFKYRRRIYEIKSNGEVVKTRFPSDLISPSQRFAVKIKHNRTYITDLETGKTRRVESFTPLYLFENDTALMYSQGEISDLVLLDLNTLEQVYQFKALEMPDAYDPNGMWFAEAEEEENETKDIVLEKAGKESKVWFIRP